MHIIDIGLLLNPKMKQVHLKLLLCLLLAISATGQFPGASTMGQMGGQPLTMGQSSFSALGGFSGMGAFGQQPSASQWSSGFGQLGTGLSSFGQQSPAASQFSTGLSSFGQQSPAASQFSTGLSSFGQQSPAASQFSTGLSSFGQQSPATSQFSTGLTSFGQQTPTAQVTTDTQRDFSGSAASISGAPQQSVSDVSVLDTNTNNNPNTTCNNIIDLDFQLFSDVCSVLPQTVYSLPNFFGHQSKQQLNDGLVSLSPVIFSQCFKKMRLFVCPLFFPPCDGQPVLPCASFCRAVKNRCTGFDLSTINCDRLPQTSEFCPAINERNAVDPVVIRDLGSNSLRGPQLPPSRGSPINAEPSAITFGSINGGVPLKDDRFTFVNTITRKTNENNFDGRSSYTTSNNYGSVPPAPPSNSYGGGSSYTSSNTYGSGSSYTPNNSYGSAPPSPPTNSYGGGSSYGSSNNYGGGSSYTSSNTYSSAPPSPPTNSYGGGSSYASSNSYGSAPPSPPTKSYGGGSSYVSSNSYGSAPPSPPTNSYGGGSSYGSSSSYGSAPPPTPPTNSYGGGSSYGTGNSYSGGSSYGTGNSYGGSYAVQPTGPPFGIQSTGAYSNYYPEKLDLSKCGPQPPANNPCTPYGAQFYPLPGYPECYIQCVFNRPVVKPCPNLLVWNARINVCDWATVGENTYSGSGYGSSSYNGNNNNYGSSSYSTQSPSQPSYSYGRKKRSTTERKKRYMGGGSPIVSEVPLAPPMPGITPLPGFFGPIGLPGPILPIPPLAPLPPFPPMLPLPFIPPFPGILPPIVPGFGPPVPPIPPFGGIPPFGPIPPIGPIPPPIFPPMPLPPFIPPLVPPLPIPLGGPLLPPLPMSLPATFIPGPPPIFGPPLFGAFGGPLDPFGIGFGPMGLPFGDPFFADPFGPGFGFGGGYPFGDDLYGYDDYDRYGSKYGYKDNYKGGYNGGYSKNNYRNSNYNDDYGYSKNNYGNSNYNDDYGYSKNNYGNSNYNDDYGYSKSKYGNNNYNSYGSNNYDNGYSSNKNYRNNNYYSDYRKKREYSSDIVGQLPSLSLTNQQRQIPQSVKISYNPIQSPISYDSINQQQLSSRLLPNIFVQSQIQLPSQEISQPLIQPSPCVGKMTPLNVPHPTDPTKYISCLNEQKYEIMECPGDLIYNPTTDQCEKIKNVESICEREKPCLNDGQCYKTSSTTFKCSCRGPWTGERCETPLSSCALNPCGEGNECHTLKTTDYKQDYVCVCDRQRSYGLSCERNTVPNPCVSGSNQGEEYYAFAFSAHAYVQCNGIIPYIRPCALGLYWNQELKICDREETAPVRPAEDQPLSYQIQYNSKSYNRPIVSLTDQNVDRQQGFRYRNYNPNILSNDQSKTYNQINSRSETPIINSYTSVMPFKSIRRFQNPSQYTQIPNQQSLIADQQYGQLLNQNPQFFQGSGQRSIVESSKPSSTWVVDNPNTQPTIATSSSYGR